MELVLKTSDPARDRGFESHPLRHYIQLTYPIAADIILCIIHQTRSGTQVAEEDGLLNR